MSSPTHAPPSTGTTLGAQNGGSTTRPVVVNLCGANRSRLGVTLAVTCFVAACTGTGDCACDDDVTRREAAANRNEVRMRMRFTEGSLAGVADRPTVFLRLTCPQ